MRWWMWVLGTVAAIWGLVCLGMAMMQERLLFPGAYRTEEPGLRVRLDALAAEVGATPMELVTADGVHLYAWHHHQPPQDRLVITVHGNASDVTGLLHHATALRELGWNTLAFSLRGFPGSEGEPSQAGMVLDLRAAWEHATGPLGYSPDRIVLHGTSMGGGVVGQLLPELPAAGAVMEATYNSVRAIAQAQYPLLPIRLLLRHPFDTLALAPTVTLPVLQVHSVDDELIPIANARALAQAWPDGTWVEVSGLGHNQSVLLGTEPGRRAWTHFLEEVVPRR
jgi:fermentation-respiration switch protein FrsA (DUF1100 family)